MNNANPKLLGSLIVRVIDAGSECDRFDAGTARDCPRYHQLAHEANSKDVAFRQHLAWAIFLAGNGAMKGSRAFDNCFENNDGDQVVAFLVQRAREDSKMERAIAHDFGGSIPARWIETAARLASPQPCLI